MQRRKLVLGGSFPRVMVELGFEPKSAPKKQGSGPLSRRPGSPFLLGHLCKEAEVPNSLSVPYSGVLVFQCPRHDMVAAASPSLASPSLSMIVLRDRGGLCLQGQSDHSSKLIPDTALG